MTYPGRVFPCLKMPVNNDLQFGFTPALGKCGSRRNLVDHVGEHFIDDHPSVIDFVKR